MATRVTRNEPEPATEAEQEWFVNAVADVLEAHDFDDGYVALLMAALDETGDLRTAVDLANDAWEHRQSKENRP